LTDPGEAQHSRAAILRLVEGLFDNARFRSHDTLLLALHESLPACCLLTRTLCASAPAAISMS
jgi:hypothetical protein